MKRNRNPTNKPVMKRYATLDSPFGSRSFSYHPPIILLSFSYRSPIILLSFSYRSPIGKRKTIRKQYGNNTEWSEGRAKDERKTSERRTNEDRRNKGD